MLGLGRRPPPALAFLAEVTAKVSAIKSMQTLMVKTVIHLQIAIDIY